MDEGIMELDVLERIFDGRTKPTDLKLSALQSITGNFSEERIIGTGGFGTVYKGVLRNGEVAVKRIKNNHTIDENVFRREVNSLLNVSHENIVRFLGFCSHTEHKVFQNEGSRDYIYAESRERILCFEYINNKSLEKYIADELRGLQWDTRYSIIKGICKGLQYLHMEKQIIHMDLKPANILIDCNMVAKITDFGLSRMEENAQTKSTTRVSSPGYTAPEYIDKGEMSVKYDVYSLGIIIIEMVTGHRRIPNSKIVLRRWRHRLHKSGKGTPFRYQQIAKLIEIGLLCQEKDPYKRPFISDIIHVINELEITDRKISNVEESSVVKISPYTEDDMLGIQPLELRFPFNLNSHVSCSLELTNETNGFIAFIVQTTSPLPYCIQPNKDIVPPRSKYCVNITLQPLDKAPQDNYTGNFIVRSTKVKESLINEDITEYIFNRDDGKLVDEVNLTITYKDEVQKVDVPLGSLIISDTINLYGAQESNVPPTEAESKISASTSDEVIDFEPLELCFPLVPHKKVLSSVKLINITDSYVCLMLSYPNGNTAKYYRKSPMSIMPPRSTQWLTLTREGKEDAAEDMQFNDHVNVWYAIVAEDIKASDLHRKDYNECKILPVVLTKIISCTSNELIQFDPPELSFPCPNKTSLSSVNIVNITDCYIGFNIWSFTENDMCYNIKPRRGILPPQTTERVVVKKVHNKEETEDDVQCKKTLFVWNMIVAQGVNASNLRGQVSPEDSKEIPLNFQKASPCTTNDLIQFDPPVLSLPFIPNKPLVFSVNIVNSTDYCVGFNSFGLKINVGRYYSIPKVAVMPARSTQRMVVKRVPDKKELNGMQCEDKFFLCSSLVSEGIESSDIVDYTDYEGRKDLPIVYKKTSLCTSDELIMFDPPQLPFTFIPNKSLSMFRLFNVVNVTDYNVGFSIWSHEGNSAWYMTNPKQGILPPQSTQAIKVRRTPKEKEPEDIRCKDKMFVWNGIVTEGVEVSDVGRYWKDEDKEFPIVLTKITSSTSVELIKFEPPEVFFPFLPSKSLTSSIKIVNITDYHIGFNMQRLKSNVALYTINPWCGILPPLSTQELVVTRVAKEDAPELEDMQCKDKFFVWSGFVTEDVNASDLKTWMPIAERKELPIAFTEKSSNELIQFDPPELCLPALPNQRVLSSAKIVNITDQYIGFRICTKKSNSARYAANPSEGILPPLSTQEILVTMIPEKNELEDTQCIDKFLVWNGIVTEDVKASDVIDNMSEIKCTNLPIFLTKTSSSTSDELIQFDPPELHFPFLPNKKVTTSIKIVNLTDYNLGFNTYSSQTNAAWYHTEPLRGILPPGSTRKLMVTREEKEDALKDNLFNDKYFVWKRVVSEGIKDSDLSDYMADQESTELPIVLDKICSSIPDELIRWDPAELCIPLLLNKTMLFRVTVVNTTDFYVAFDVYWIGRNAPWDKRSVVREGILPPRSTKKITIGWVTTEKELEDMESNGDYFVWSRVVTERVEKGDIIAYMGENENMKLPLILNKANPCTSNELIQFDPPELSLPFMPNKPLVFSVNIVNNTDYCVGFDIGTLKSSVGQFFIQPDGGVMQPRSTQRLVVKRVPQKKEQEDMQCEDKFYIWSRLVSEGVEVSDFDGRITYEESKNLPIAYKKSLSTSDELIQFDPPQLPFPFLPNKRVSMIRLFKIVNVTDHSVGFRIWTRKNNSSRYTNEPKEGILPPQSAQTIKVRRTLKENETEDMQSIDQISVWNGIVTEGVQVSDLHTYASNEENKELPIVLTKPGESSSR